jgi:hypothetical protein
VPEIILYAHSIRLIGELAGIGMLSYFGHYPSIVEADKAMTLTLP